MVNDNTDLISVIIPVYQTEKYLLRCLNSLIGQSYQNLEIILIDDGSTEGSGNLCDQLVARDERIHVVHKENNGVSAARNTGLQYAKGEYIFFADSDDYANHRMLEVLIKAILSSEADISVCGFYQEKNRGDFEVNWPEYLERDILGEEQIKCLLQNKYYTCSCWGKLFRRAVIGGIRFDCDIAFYEDYYFLYEVFKKSSATAFISEPLYYYCNNNQSAARKPFNIRKIEVERVCRAVMEDIRYEYPELYKIAKAEYVRIIVFCCSMIASADGDYSDEIKQLQKRTRSMMPDYILSYASIGYKLNAVLIAISWELFKKVRRL